jgi:glutamyl-tRNA synthetase
MEEATRLFCEEVNWTTKEFFMLLREIMTGSTESPPLFETMEVLGKDECLARLQDAVAAFMLE